MWNLTDIDLQKKYIEEQITSIVNKIEETLGFTELDTLLHNVDKIYEISKNSAALMELANIKDRLINLSQHINDIIAVEPVSENITKMVDLSNNLSILLDIFNNLSHIVNDSQNIGSIKTVSQNIDSVNTVASDKTNIDAVAGNKANIDNVASNKSNIDTLANNIASIAAVAIDILKVVNVSHNIDSVNIVSSNINKVKDVGNNINKVVQVANDVANVDAVANDLQNIDNVAQNKTNIDNVASIRNDVVTVSQNKDDVATVSQNITNVNTVAEDRLKIASVVQNKQNIDSVASNIANVNKVASNETNINTVALNENNINIVSENINNVNTVAESINDVQNVSSNIDDVRNYADTYLGSKDSEPSARNDGSVLVVGDLYFNTQTKLMNVWDGTQWQAAYASVNAYNKDESDARYEKLANKVISFQETPDDAHYPTEKLVSDSLNLKADKAETYTKSEVDTSLSMKEDIANKVTSFGTTPSDNKYPSEKLVKDSLDVKADKTTLNSHVSDTNNPHQVTKEQVGLGNVDNTSDLDKPISTATQNALNNKANKNLDNVNASDILAKVKTVDGSGSLLDADLLDGKHLEQIEGRVMSKAEFEALAGIRRHQYAGSGFVEWGTTPSGYTTLPGTQGIFKVNTDGIMRMSQDSIVNVNGYLIKPFMYNDRILRISFPAPPTSLAHITDSSNLPVDMKQGDFVILDELGRELVTNGTFDTGINGWEGINADITDDGGSIKIAVNTDTTYTHTRTFIKVLKGVKYKLTYQYLGSSDGSNQFGIYLNGERGYILPITHNHSPGLHEVIFTSRISGGIYLGIVTNNADMATDRWWKFDNISLKQIEPTPIIALQDASAGIDIYQNIDKFEGRDSISRQDLVFLETWHEDIAEKDIVYPYGNIQYRGGDTDGLSGIADGSFAGADTYSLFGNWQDAGDLVGKGYRWSQLSEADKIKLASNPDNNIYKDGDKWVQVRYRVRVIKGLGNEWENPTHDSTAYIWYRKAYSALGYPAGYNSVTCPIMKKTYRATIEDDIALLTSDNNKFFGNTLVSPEYYNNSEQRYSIFSGFSEEGSYALPIALVQRRNTGIYHPVYNPEGTALIAYDDGSTGLDAVEWWQVPDDYISSLADCFEPNKIATYNPGTGSVGTLANIQDGYYVTGTIASGKSGRSDNLFGDEVNERDVEDLRMSAHKKPYKEILNELNNKAVAGDVRGKENYGEVKIIGKIYSSDSISNNWLAISDGNGGYINHKEKIKLGDIAIWDNGANRYVDYVIEVADNHIRTSTYAPRVAGSNIIVLDSKTYTYNNTLTHTDIIGVPRKLQDRVKYDVDANEPGNVNIVKNDYVKKGGHYYRALVARSNVDLSADDYTNTTNWIDLGTDGNIGGYPDLWFGKGIEGIPLLIGEEGGSLLPMDVGTSSVYQVIKLSKKLTRDLVVIVRKKDGTFVKYTKGNKSAAKQYEIDTVGNTILFNISQSYADLGYSSEQEMLDLMVVLVTYETKTNFLELANNNSKWKCISEVRASNFFGNSHGAWVARNLLNKVPSNGHIANISAGNLKSIRSLPYPFTTDNYYYPEHDSFNMSRNFDGKNAAKFVSGIIVENNRAYLQYVFKELKYDADSNSWGDDNKFQITNKVSTITDLNGNRVLFGQKRFALPYFIDEE